jgi:hypothetical protein
MTPQQLTVKMAISAWETQVSRAEKIFHQLSDEQLWQEVSPGRNRGIYLLGHLIAVNDGLFKLFGLGERMYPELDAPFVAAPDKTNIEFPSTASLRQYWTALHEQLAEKFQHLTAEEWFQRHHSMTDEDFIKEPHRNKLSVLLNRTSHIAYHLGQVALIEK